MPVTVVLVLLVNRAGLRSASSPSPTPSPTRSVAAPRTALPTVRVAAPPASAAAARSCPAFLATLPLTLTYVAAWGEPPVLLRCGVPRPPGFVVGAQTIVVNGVAWYPEPHGARTVWTAVDRPVYVEVTVPTGYASGPVAELSTGLARTLPATPPRPGR